MPVLGVAPTGNLAQTITALQGLRQREQSDRDRLASQERQGTIGSILGGLNLAAGLYGDYTKQQATQEMAAAQHELAKQTLASNISYREQTAAATAEARKRSQYGAEKSWITSMHGSGQLTWAQFTKAIADLDAKYSAWPPAGIGPMPSPISPLQQPQPPQPPQPQQTTYGPMQQSGSPTQLYSTVGPGVLAAAAGQQSGSPPQPYSTVGPGVGAQSGEMGLTTRQREQRAAVRAATGLGIDPSGLEGMTSTAIQSLILGKREEDKKQTEADALIKILGSEGIQVDKDLPLSVASQLAARAIQTPGEKEGAEQRRTQAESTEELKRLQLSDAADRKGLVRKYNIEGGLPERITDQRINQRQDEIRDTEFELEERLGANVPHKQAWADRAMQEMEAQGTSTALDVMRLEHEILFWGGRLSQGRMDKSPNDPNLRGKGAAAKERFYPSAGGGPGGWMSRERLGKYVKAKDYEAIGSLAALWISQLPEGLRADGLRYFHDQLEAAGANMQEFYLTGPSEIPERSVTDSTHQAQDEKYRLYVAEAIALMEQANKRRGKEYTGGTLPAPSEGFSQHFSGGLPFELSRPFGRLMGRDTERVESFEDAADQQRTITGWFDDFTGPRWIDRDVLNELIELRRRHPEMKKPR